MTITASEQLLIEMINRARLDPVSEAVRFGVDLNAGLDAGTISEDAKQALAPNTFLHAASDTHGQWMIDEDTFSHSGAGNNTPMQRMENAGYVFAGSYSAGENITYRGSTGPIDLNAMMETYHHRDLFLSEGHRKNMLSENYRELGVSQIEGVFTNSKGTDFNSSMVTENFAKTGSNYFVTGVAYTDTDNDGFYSIGEGQSGVSVSAQGTAATTLSAGGYAIAVTGGTQTAVSIGGISINVDMSSSNAKVDLVDGVEILTSVTTVLVSSGGALTALGYADVDLTGSSGADILTGNRNDNILRGEGGDDVLNGGAGADTLFGGDGDDRAVLEAEIADADITVDGDGIVTIIVGDETDVIEGVETFQFSDQTISLEDLTLLVNGPPATDLSVTLVGTLAGNDDLQGGTGDDFLYGDGASVAHMGTAAWQVYRLYEATLGRAPDLGGLQGWTSALFEEREALTDAAAGFIRSAEFGTRYGTGLSDSEFVQALYDNVLGRNASVTEEEAWVLQIEGGRSRAEVVTGFSESREFINRTQNDATVFIDESTESTWTGTIYRMYVATLDRTPDAAGMVAWTDALSSGMSDYSSLPNGFIAGREFQKTYGDLDDSEFVELLYQNVLGRSADAAGLTGWLDAMNNGLDRSAVVLGFSESGEFKSNTADAMTTWLRVSVDAPSRDVLSGNGGRDVLVGGVGADTFVFNAEDGGDHRVLGLEVWDQIELNGFGYVDTAAAVTQFETVGGDVVFDDGGLRITFEDVEISMFDESLMIV